MHSKTSSSLSNAVLWPALSALLLPGLSSAAVQAEFSTRGSHTYEPAHDFVRVNVGVTLRSPISGPASIELTADRETSSVSYGANADCTLVDSSSLPTTSVTLNFPAGSPAGTTVTATVHVYADSASPIAESVEALQLRLRNPVGVALGGQYVHIVEVSDVDDFALGLDMYGVAGGADSLVVVDKNNGKTLRRSAWGARGVAPLTALAFHPGSGTYYGVANDGFRYRAPAGLQFTVDGMRSSEFVSVNPESGDATPLFGLGARGINSLHWDSSGSRMLACDGEHATFYQVDVSGATAPLNLGQALHERIEGITVAPSIFASGPNAIFGVRDFALHQPGSPAPAGLIEVESTFGSSDELCWFSEVTSSAADQVLAARAIEYNPQAGEFYVSVFTKDFEWEIWTYDHGVVASLGLDYLAPAARTPALEFAVSGLHFDANSGRLFGTESGTNLMVEINPSTGTVQRPQGGTTTVDDLRGMTRVQGALYGADNGRKGLVRLDDKTGLATPVGTSGFRLPDFGGNGLGDEVMEGLAYSAAGNLLYGLASDAGFGVVTTISQTTGIATPIGAPVPGQFKGLTYVPVNPAGLYATDVSLTSGDPDLLLRYDIGLSSWTMVGKIETAGGAVFEGTLGLGFDSASLTLYGLSSFSGLSRQIAISLAGGPSSTVISFADSGAQFSESLAFNTATGRLDAENMHGHLLEVEPATAQCKSIGSFGHGLAGRSGINAMANVNDVLYGIDRTAETRDVLVVIDRVSGTTQSVTPLLVPGAFNPGGIDCLTNIRGVLHGVYNSGTPGFWEHRLVTVDPTTGTVSLVGVLSGNAPGPTDRVTGLAWDGSLLLAMSTGDVFGTTANYFSNLWTIDPSSAVTDFVFVDFPLASGTSLRSNGGMAFDGTQFYATVEAAIPGQPILDQLIRFPGTFVASGLVEAELLGRPSHTLMKAIAFVDTQKCPPFVRGDGNGDGSINIADTTFMLNHLFSPPSQPVPSLDALDYNDDGGLNLADVVYLLNYLFAAGSPPPAPFDAPGQDPTPDGLDC